MVENTSLNGMIEYIRVNAKGKDFENVVEIFYNVLNQIYEQDSMGLMKAFSETHGFDVQPFSTNNEALNVKFNDLVYRLKSTDIQKILTLMDMLNHKALSSAYVLVLMEE